MIFGGYPAARIRATNDFRSVVSKKARFSAAPAPSAATEAADGEGGLVSADGGAIWSREGALIAINEMSAAFAASDAPRSRVKPLMGTWGGFRHSICVGTCCGQVEWDRCL